MFAISCSITRYFIILLISIGLVNCMVGPNFHPPKLPAKTQYIKGQSLTKTADIPMAGKSGKSQYFVINQSIPSEWWHVFHSSELNSLIQMGFAHSPNLAAANAALAAAKANYFAQFGNLFPTVAGNFSAERERFSLSTFGVSNSSPVGSRVGTSVFNLFNVNVSVAYTLDVFGGLRRQIEAAGAQIDYQQFELKAAFLTLSSNIVTTAITIASLKTQIKTTHQLINTQEKTLAIIKQQARLGSASETDILLQGNQLAQLRATLPPLKQQLAQNFHVLSILIGTFPQESLPTVDLEQLNLPSDLPISCPAALIRQRPDIRASEALLHAASAQIGVATANLLPQINLTGNSGGSNYGWQSTVLSTLFEKQNQVWTITGALTQPIFNGGSLIAKRRAAIATYNQAFAEYKQTVLQALQNVADTLRALQHDADLLKAQKIAEITARNSLHLAQKQFSIGGIDYQSVLTAERAYQQAIINRIQAQAARYTDTAALFQALGGGWWSQSSPKT